jgi:hypothetical protein
MRMRYFAAALAVALPLSAGAGVMIDVEVSEVGGGIWHYDYFVSGELFNAPPAAPGPHGFSLYFDYELYGALSNESTTNTTWDLFVEQPDEGFFLEGLFDALAASTPAETSAPFGVDFEWLGMGTPSGVQRFEYYTCVDAVCSGFTDLWRGTTARAQPTPVPGSLLLVGAGLMGLRLRQGLRSDRGHRRS